MQKLYATAIGLAYSFYYCRMKTNLRPLQLAFLLVLGKIALHLATANNLGFHRDEFLYLALGQHLDWGYWSNPPFIGAISWISQHILGDSIWATRFLPALSGAGMLWIMALTVRSLGGGLFAQLLSGLSLFGSIAWLRAFSMLQPVPFDIFFWAWLSYLSLQWLKTKEAKWWYYMGIVAGFGFLNKYSIGFWAISLLVGLLFTANRRVLGTRGPWYALGIGLVIALPNIIWQWKSGFPVFEHLKALNDTQLQYVKSSDFIKGQFLMHGPFLFIWVAGALVLLQSKKMLNYRALGWQYLVLIALLLLLKGKEYYSLGAYPVLFAVGAVYWERNIQKLSMRIIFTSLLVLFSIPLLPTGLPLFPTTKLVAYFKWLSQDLGVEGPLRWEGGNLHVLPQDYADMLGWDELAAATDRALAQAGDLNNCIIYGENYGEAGAIDHFCHKPHPPAISFSDSYLLWAPDTLAPNVNTFIYINDELGDDVKDLFTDIQPMGGITDSLAREYGTMVYLCRQPKRSFPAFWAERMREVRR
jgi:hypothetical protein